MSRLLPLLAAALIASPAYAKGKKKGDDKDGKFRVKVSTPLAVMNTTTVEIGNTSADASVRGVTIGNGGSRLEGGYLFTPNIEAGLMVGLSSLSTDVSGSDVSYSTLGANVYGAYNKALSDKVTGYLQVAVGVSQDSVEGDRQDSFTNFGGGVGVRLRPIKRASVDLQAEYFGGSGSAYDANGDKVENYTIKLQNIALMMGVAVRI